jgi:hypothetical protein
MFLYWMRRPIFMHTLAEEAERKAHQWFGCGASLCPILMWTRILKRNASACLVVGISNFDAEAGSPHFETERHIGHI